MKTNLSQLDTRELKRKKKLYLILTIVLFLLMFISSVIAVKYAYTETSNQTKWGVWFGVIPSVVLLIPCLVFWTLFSETDKVLKSRKNENK